MISTIIFILIILAAYEFESSHDSIIDDASWTLVKSRKWHMFSAAVLACLGGALCYFFVFGPAGLVLLPIFLLRLLFAVMYLSFSRMTYFNIRLNQKNGWDTFHLGENGWDGFFNKNPKLYYIIAGAITIASAVMLFIL